nr:dihydrodipicolinate synthase family protein [uncultured Enterobacter sp.]
MFTGMVAFPLTPFRHDKPDEGAYNKLVQRLSAAQVDGICAMGSTGSYAYLTRVERARFISLTVSHVGRIPVMASIGALNQRDVLDAAYDAQKAGAQALLLAPVAYQRLTPDEVFALFEKVTQNISVPLCVYDNPATTQFTFDDALLTKLAALPHVQSIKLPGGLPDADGFFDRIHRLRAILPAHMTLGVSGDAFATAGLSAGCDVWYSVLGGLYPNIAMALTRAVRERNLAGASDINARLEPLWALFRQHGSLRVIATAAELEELGEQFLPLPLKSLDGDDREVLRAVLAEARSQLSLS